MPSRPVRPNHAASLILTRKHRGHLQVLMGRRPSKAVFGSAYVFPGGRLDRDDKLVAPSSPLNTSTMEEMCNRGGCTPIMAAALATAAIRETFEETGLMLASPGSLGPVIPKWSAFSSLGLAPAHDRLKFVGRAITPTSAPIRFHARFFTATSDGLLGELKGNGELLDLDWYPLETARSFPAIDVTKFILSKLEAIALSPQQDASFFRYRRNKPVMGRASNV